MGNNAPDPLYHALSGTLDVLRNLRVAVLCNWPVNPGPGGSFWEDPQTEANKRREDAVGRLRDLERLVEPHEAYIVPRIAARMAGREFTHREDLVKLNAGVEALLSVPPSSYTRLAQKEEYFTSLWVPRD